MTMQVKVGREVKQVMDLSVKEAISMAVEIFDETGLEVEFSTMLGDTVVWMNKTGRLYEF